MLGSLISTLWASFLVVGTPLILLSNSLFIATFPSCVVNKFSYSNNIQMMLQLIVCITQDEIL